MTAISSRRPWLWALKATLGIYLWTLLFWFVFFVLFAYEVLDIPMGLGGAVYPAIFTVPVLLEISGYSQASLDAIARKLNERPRKTLGFRTPAEMFDECVASIG